MIMGIVFLVSVAVVVLNMIVDILYCLIDPGSASEASAQEALRAAAPSPALCGSGHGVADRGLSQGAQACSY